MRHSLIRSGNSVFSRENSLFFCVGLLPVSFINCDETGKIDLRSNPEYIRLLEREDRWAKLDVPIDRVTLCKELDRVRNIRNDVMHFDPDGIPPDDLKRLRDFEGFLQRLQAVGVPC